MLIRPNLSASMSVITLVQLINITFTINRRYYITQFATYLLLAKAMQFSVSLIFYGATLC